MIRQIRLLTKLQLCNLFSVNEFRYTKDKKKKWKILVFGILWIYLIGLLSIYAAALSFGLCKFQMGRMVPALLSMVICLMVFMFAVFKTGEVVFGRKSHEFQIPLPVTTTAVIISRFLAMYFTNFCLGVFVMVPGLFVYGWMEKPGIWFYFYGLIGISILPLLPLTLATIIGAGIVAVAARWKHKNFLITILSLAFVMFVFLGSLSLSGMQETELNAMLLNLAELMEKQIGTVYPPALWLSKAMVEGEHLWMLLFVAVSVGLFVIFVAVLQKNYGKIYSMLNAYETKKAYEMGTLQEKSVLKSLWERELRHYFSSSIYVTNTMVGYVILVVIAIAVLVMGPEEVERMTGIPGILKRGLPIVLGMMPVMMPTTASAISIEGKEWWIAQTLPISMNELLKSKILSNLTAVAPFYLVAELLVVIAIRPEGTELLWMVLVPALYIVFGAVAGITVNLKFPVFQWDSEVQVVKQSASVFVMMLVGVVCTMLPLAAAILCRKLSSDLLFGGTVLLLGGLTAFCWRICHSHSVREK